MSSQKKLIGDILSLYDVILEKKNVDETATTLRSTLGSLGYKEKGSELTSGGNVNDKLTDIVIGILKQFKTNYPAATVTVTSGNDKFHQGVGYKSQHTIGNAIDVTLTPYDSKSAAAFLAILNNTVRSTPGFTYLDEYTKPSKAATGGHYHLQYGTDTTTSQTGTTTSQSGTTDTTDTETSGTTSDVKGSSSRDFVKSVGGELLKAAGIQESFKSGSFGSNAKIKNGRVIIPRNSNTKIKSPVSGNVVDVISNSSCVNQIIIEFEDGFLEYCGITSPSEKVKDRVGVGTVLGTTNSNVSVTLYTHSKRKETIVFDTEKTEVEKEKEKNKETDNSDLSNKGAYAQMLIKGYRNVKKSFDKKTDKESDKKIEENIKRIKGLL